MQTSAASNLIEDQLDEFYELLRRARQLFPAGMTPPPAVATGVVEDGRWVR